MRTRLERSDDLVMENESGIKLRMKDVYTSLVSYKIILVVCHLLSVGRRPVGNLAVLRLCRTRTQVHHVKKTTPTAISNTTDRLTAIATKYSVPRKGLPLPDCTPRVGQ